MGRAADAWRARVLANEEQALRARSALGGRVSLEPCHGTPFDVTPVPAGDPLLGRLGRLIGASSTVLDVGAGAGRYALPLAQRCAGVLAIDPSLDGVQAIRRAAASQGLANVRVLQSTWESANVPVADVVLCAHTLYGIAEIEPFIQKLTQTARGHVAAVLYTESPLAIIDPFWMAVHGERRAALPAATDLLPVLWELGLAPKLVTLPALPVEVVPSREAAVALLRQLLCLDGGSALDARLTGSLDSLLIETALGVTARDAPRRIPAMLSWSGAA
ncbi:MAG: class I SAM-dependent methyltransferase [Chloroflexota bacterium]